MKKFLHRVKDGFIYVITNYFVNSIPFWNIRKILYKILGVKIGKNSQILMKTIIQSPKNISIGDNSIINEHCYLDGRGGLYIGNNVSISFYSTIITGSHLSNSSEFVYMSEPVIIEDNVWLGAHAIVLNGSKILRGTIIGAGSVYKGITEQYSIYLGNPAKKVKDRELERDYRINYKSYFR